MKGFKIIKELINRVISCFVRVSSNNVYISSELGPANCRVVSGGNVYVGGTANNAYMKVVYVQNAGEIEKAVIAEVI